MANSQTAAEGRAKPDQIIGSGSRSGVPHAFLQPLSTVFVSAEELKPSKRLQRGSQTPLFGNGEVDEQLMIHWLGPPVSENQAYWRTPHISAT